MSPAKIKEHEPTAVRREDTSSSGQDPKERLRRSGMTQGTAGSTETGDEYQQGGSRDKQIRVIYYRPANNDSSKQ